MNITVTCEHATPLGIAVKAIRQCYESGDKSDSYYMGEFQNGEPFKLGTTYKLGEKDKALIERIIKSGHTSTLEHYRMIYEIECESLNELELYKNDLLKLLTNSKGVEFEIGHTTIFININIRTLLENFKSDNLIIKIIKQEFKCQELYNLLELGKN